MRKTFLAIATAATMSFTAIAAPGKAEARCYGCLAGAGIAAAVIGGAVLANRGYRYGPGYYGGYGYAPYGGYAYAPARYRYGYRPRYYTPRYAGYRSGYYGHRW